jgi:hypothetical protein
MRGKKTAMKGVRTWTNENGTGKVKSETEPLDSRNGCAAHAPFIELPVVRYVSLLQKLLARDRNSLCFVFGPESRLMRLVKEKCIA